VSSVHFIRRSADHLLSFNPVVTTLCCKRRS
jgi:hypothetical protein